MTANRPASTGAEIADVLADWTTSFDGPLYERLAAALRGAIDRGELGPGTQLPPERALAVQLVVSRKTVLAAFDSLKADGWLSSRQGSGTWVTLPPGRRWTMGAVDSLASLSGILHASRGSLINMTTGHLEAAPLLRTILADLTGPEMERLLTSQNPEPLGIDSLRASIERQMRLEGVPAEKDTIIVTTGTQQALSLLASHYLRPGDLVIVEAATSLGALDAFRAVGSRVETIPDPPRGDGIDQLLRLASDRRPSLIYLIPTHNNVTGAVVGSLERRRIARFAEETGIPVIEDRSHSSVGFTSPLPPPLASLTSTAEMAVVDSMSKRAWSGLRVGWIVAPPSAIGPLGRAKSVADLGTPQLSQYVAQRTLDRAAEVDAERRDTAWRRLRLLSEELRTRLPEWEWEEPTGGLSLWIRLPGGNARQFAQHALRTGVAVLPGPLLSAGGHYADRIRVSYHLPEAELVEGAARLQRAWARYA